MGFLSLLLVGVSLVSNYVADLVGSTAAAVGVPPAIAVEVARRESGFDQAARGTSGEVGVMQLMEGTAGELGVDRYDLGDNIRGGVEYLRRMFDQFGSWSLALAAYNAGPGNVRAGRIPESTQQYVADVLGAAGPLSMPAAVPFYEYGPGVVEREDTALFWWGVAAVAGAGLLLAVR